MHSARPAGTQGLPWNGSGSLETSGTGLVAFQKLGYWNIASVPSDRGNSMSQKLSHQNLLRVNTPLSGLSLEDKEVGGCTAPGHIEVWAFKAPSGGDWGAELEVSRKRKRQDEELAGD